MVVIELATWALKVAMMVEEIQAAEKLLATSADQFDDPLGADEAVLSDMAEDFQIAFGELKCSSGIGIALEAREPLLFFSHARIVSRIKPLQVVERLLDSSGHRHFCAVR